MTTDPAQTPREPEIEVLGRVVFIALRVLRGVSVLAGLAAIAAAIYTMIDPLPLYGESGIPPAQAVIAQQITLVCIGLPLALPVAFTLGRGCWIALLIGAGWWFGPMLLDGDHDYGFVIRMFASLVGVAVILVWQTLFRLTRPLPNQPDK